MPAYEDLPYTQAAIGEILRAGGLRAYSSIPSKNPQYPLCVITRAGGVPGERHALDGPRIQIDAWGDEQTSEKELWGVAREAWRLCLEAEGTHVEVGGADPERVFIAGVDPEIGPQEVPDQRTARPRIIFSLRVYARGSVLAS